jgi:hypothetical protein
MDLAPSLVQTRYVPAITPRLRARIDADFPKHADMVVDRLRSLDPLVVASRQNPERMFAAIVRLADGHLDKLDSAIGLARLDWRDLLVAADFANEDWPARLAAWFDRQSQDGDRSRRDPGPL